MLPWSQPSQHPLVYITFFCIRLRHVPYPPLGVVFQRVVLFPQAVTVLPLVFRFERLEDEPPGNRVQYGKPQQSDLRTQDTQHLCNQKKRADMIIIITPTGVSFRVLILDGTLEKILFRVCPIIWLWNRMKLICIFNPTLIFFFIRLCLIPIRHRSLYFITY